MPAYPIPPWLSQPANPAAHYQQGLAIGARIGAEQAAQAYQQQQIAREQQRDAFEEQLAAQKQQLAIDEVTRKHKAIADYQAMVQGGTDPLEALKMVGPDMGVPVASIINAEEGRKERMAREASLEQYRRDEIALRRQGQEEAQAKAREQGQARAQAQRIALQRALQADPEIKQLVKDLTAADAELRTALAETPSFLGKRQAAIAEDVKKAQDRVAELRTKLEGRRAEVVGEVAGGGGEDAGGMREAPGEQAAAPVRRLRWTPQGIVPVGAQAAMAGAQASAAPEEARGEQENFAPE